MRLTKSFKSIVFTFPLYLFSSIVDCAQNSGLPSETALIESDTILVDEKSRSVIDGINGQDEPEQKNGKEIVLDTALQFANWIDHYFGEPEELESASYNYLRLVNRLGWREGESIKYRPRVKAKIHLPKINRKLSLFFSDDNDYTSDNLNNNPINSTLLDENEEHRTAAAVNYDSDIYNGSKFSTRLGLNSSFKTFALIKHSMTLYEDNDLQIKSLNYLFWEDLQGLGVNPKIELDKIIDDNQLFRWKYSILRSEKSEGNEWRNRFSIVNRFSPDRWISYDLDIIGASEQDYDVETYRLAFRYRHQLAIKWLYFEIEPEFLWRKSQQNPDRKFIPGIIFRLEVQFEN